MNAASARTISPTPISPRCASVFSSVSTVLLNSDPMPTATPAHSAAPIASKIRKTWNGVRTAPDSAVAIAAKPGMNFATISDAAP